MSNVMYELNIKFTGNDHAENADIATLLRIFESMVINKEVTTAMNDDYNMMVLRPVALDFKKIKSDDEDDEDN